jgi:hypothetical protein
VTAAREHSGHTVAAGRAWVAAYIDFIHYVEGLHGALTAAHHGADGSHEAHAH